MEEKLLREIANDYLVPMFSGASLEESQAPSTSRHATVALTGACSIEFKVERHDEYRLKLVRAQPFASTGKTVTPELDVVQAFVDVLRPMALALTSEIKRDLLSTFQRRIVAKAVAKSNSEITILNGIDCLASWGTRLYEGSPISAALGFMNSDSGSSAIDLENISKEDYSAVLSNGHDTLLEFDLQERFIGHEALDFNGKSIPSFCPFRQAPLARWSSENSNGIVLALNRLGEILVIRDGQLVFARRSGKWSFLTHEPTLVQMGTPHNQDIRKAVYETCLDSSFSRTGACIGVVSQSHKSKLKNVVSDIKDHLSNPITTKTKTLSKIVNGRKFHELDRRLRLEITAIDGSTVISSDGDVLAIGAILKLPGGSTGGGRLAAAQELAKLGLGIKVSQDGGIIGYRLSNPTPAFIVM